jgi:hypothetical protein
MIWPFESVWKMRVTERTAALIESETKYRQLADQHQTLALVSPVGIFQTAHRGPASKS